MKKIVKLVMVLFLLMCLIACDNNTETGDNTPDDVIDNQGENQNKEDDKQEQDSVFSGIFYNASQKERNEFGTSHIELREDKSFSLVEVVGMGATEVNGLFGQEGDVLMFSYDSKINDASGNEILNFEFRIVDENTIELMRDLEGSKAGDCFSTDGTIPSGFVPKHKKQEVACTGLKAKYNYFWAIANPLNVYNLEIKVSPEDCTQTVTYVSDDESIASVDQYGDVTPGKVGKTTIHVTCGDQKLDVPVESRPKVVDLEKLEIADIVLKVGEDTTIVPKFFPENTTDKTLTFKSADTYRVSVNTDGKIVGLKPGPCEVYVTASNGKTYTTKIMVEGEFLDIDLPLYSEVSYAEGNYAPCIVFLHKYEDGKEYITDVGHDAEVHSEGGEVELVGNMLFAHADPGKETETNVWFTYKDYSTIKVTIFVQP